MDAAPAAGGPLTIDEVRSLRLASARRQRRVLFNNDGCDAACFPKTRDATPENLLAVRTSPLLGSHVDTLCYCTISSGFGLFTHTTRTGEVLLHDLLSGRNITQDLIRQGTEPLEVMADFCRRNGLELFWSMRMNDTHDAAYKPDKPYPLFPALKQEHPEYLVGAVDKRPPRGSWSSVDYTRPEVRDLAFRYIQDVCQRFPVAGVELDFFRHMCYFRRVAWGEAASAAELHVMTDLLRRVRTMADEEGARRGRPILIAARVPDSAEYARGVGLDIERWMAEHLVDMLICSGYFQLNPWEVMVQLGRRHNVPIFAGLSESRVRGETKRFRRQSVESYRGRALRAWSAGVDGIYIFNVYNAGAPFLRQIGDPASLRKLDKLYFATVRNGNPDRYLTGGKRYRTVPVLTPNDAWSLRCEQPRTVQVYVGDDALADDASGALPQVTCHVQLGSVEDAERLRITFNGQPLEPRTVKGDWVDMPVAPHMVRAGPNHLGFELERPARPAPDSPETWDVEYRGDQVLKYPDQLPWRRLFPACDFVEETRNGTLYFSDRGTGAKEMPHLIYPWTTGPDDEAVVEARVRLESSTDPRAVCVRIANGRCVEYLTIEPERAGLYFAGMGFAMDTSAELHTYQIRARGDDIRVLIDGEPRLDGTGAFTTPVSEPRAWHELGYGLQEWNRCSVLFGSASGPGTGAAYWEYVRFQGGTSFATLKDVVLAFSYAVKPGQ